jgi:hypothetical protein
MAGRVEQIAAPHKKLSGDAQAHNQLVARFKTTA